MQDKIKKTCLVDAKYKHAKEYRNILKDAVNLNTWQTKKLHSNKLAEYFKVINNLDDIFFQQDEEVIIFQEHLNIQVMFSELDWEISREIFLKSIKQLKN